VAVSSTDYLLEHITELIRDSAGSIFDATAANPNVSLEIGIAHALPADFIIALYTRQPRKRTATTPVPRPIISDLQGRNRVEYKNYEALKKQLVERYLGNLLYWKRWKEFAKNNSALVQAALKMFSDIRTSGRILRPRLQAMLAGTGIRLADLVKALTDHKLITARRGRDGGYYYPLR
jgi:hypothetical protein